MIKGIYYILENKDLFRKNQLLRDVNHESKFYRAANSPFQFNLSYPVTGLQKKIDIDDDKKM